MPDKRDDGLYAEIKHYDRNYFGQFAPVKEEGKNLGCGWDFVKLM